MPQPMFSHMCSNSKKMWKSNFDDFMMNRAEESYLCLIARSAPIKPTLIFINSTFEKV